MQAATWLMMDFEAGLCSLEQVGSPRHEGGPSADDLTASERLKRDALVAYKALGGPEYLKRNPDLLDKALLKMIAEPEKKTETSVMIKIDAPWMSPDRLSYLRERAIEAVPAEVVPHEQAPDGAKAWKDAEPVPLPLITADDIAPRDPRMVGNPSGPNATPKRSG